MGKNKSKQNKINNDDGNINDDRFIIAQTHPQFQKLHTGKKSRPKDPVNNGNLLIGVDNDKSTVVDDRFKAILTDARFAMGGDVGVKEGGVDKYGRRLKKKKKKKNKGDEDAKKEENDTSDNQIDSDEGEVDEREAVKEDDSIDGELDVNQDPESRIAYLTALSRGEIDCSSTDEDSSSDEGDDNDDKSSDDESTGSEDSIYGAAGVLDPSTKQEEKVEITYDQSKFMAVCNMDWSNVRAVDLLAVISSFSPPGSVKFVHVYPSNFGLERMEKDKMFGPVGVWKKKQNQPLGDDSGSENDEYDDIEGESSTGEDEQKDEGEEETSENELDGKYQHFKNSEEKTESDFDAEKLRAYEAAKLKYYFAVVEFVSSEAADVAYKELDGMEMGHSSSNIDFRSIPECDVADVIKGRTCRDKASVLPSNYNPPDFVVSALQQTAVKCTWEEGDKERERLLTQYGIGNETWNAMADGNDLKAYLASGELIEFK